MKRHGLAAVTLVIAVALYLPALSAGFLADDFLQIALFDGIAGQRAPWALYSLFEADPVATAAHMQRGDLPWWTTADFRFVQLRPLSSLLLALDHALLPHRAWPHHLHSLAWLVAALLGARAVFRSALGGTMAALALLVFAIDESLAWPVAWLANRCTLVAAAFGLFALARLLRGPAPSKRATLVTTLLWTLAFAAGEYALCVLAYAVAYTLVGRTDAWRRRVVELAPALLALLLFVGLYAAMGAGVSSATSYVDPLRHPGAMALAIVDRAPRILGEVMLALPADTDRLLARHADTWVHHGLLALGGGPQTPLLWAHGRAVTLVVVALVTGGSLLGRHYLSPAERRSVRWMLLGTVGAVLPLCAIMPATRALALAGLGPAAWVASVFVATGRALASRPTSWGPRLRAAALGLLTLGLCWQHVVADAIWTRVELAGIEVTGDAYARYHDGPQLDPPRLEGKHVVVLCTPGLVTGIHGRWMMHLLHRVYPASWHVLVIGQRRLLVRRSDPHTLELSTLGQPLLDQPQETLFRNPPQALHTGDTADVGLFVAQITHERPPLGPDAIQFRFDRPLDDPQLVFLQTGADGLLPWTPPPVGRAVVLAPADLPGLRAAAPR